MSAIQDESVVLESELIEIDDLTVITNFNYKRVSKETRMSEEERKSEHERAMSRALSRMNEVEFIKIVINIILLYKHVIKFCFIPEAIISFRNIYKS